MGFKIGDKVIAKVIESNYNGSLYVTYIKYIKGEIILEDDIYNSGFWVKYDTHGSINRIHHINTLELDVQYYREERLKKLLDIHIDR